MTPRTKGMRRLREAMRREGLHSRTDVDLRLLAPRYQDFLLEAMVRETELMIASTHTGAVDELVRINEQREEILQTHGEEAAEFYPHEEPW